MDNNNNRDTDATDLSQSSTSLFQPTIPLEKGLLLLFCIRVLNTWIFRQNVYTVYSVIIFSCAAVYLVLSADTINSCMGAQRHFQTTDTLTVQKQRHFSLVLNPLLNPFSAQIAKSKFNKISKFHFVNSENLCCHVKVLPKRFHLKVHTTATTSNARGTYQTIKQY